MTPKGIDFMTIQEVAERLNVSRRTVNNWINSGRLPATRTGYQWLIERQDFEAFEARYEPSPRGRKPKGQDH